MFQAVAGNGTGTAIVKIYVACECATACFLGHLPCHGSVNASFVTVTPMIQFLLVMLLEMFDIYKSLALTLAKMFF